MFSRIHGSHITDCSRNEIIVTANNFIRTAAIALLKATNLTQWLAGPLGYSEITRDMYESPANRTFLGCAPAPGMQYFLLDGRMCDILRCHAYGMTLEEFITDKLGVTFSRGEGIIIVNHGAYSNYYFAKSSKFSITTRTARSCFTKIFSTTSLHWSDEGMDDWDDTFDGEREDVTDGDELITYIPLNYNYGRRDCK